MKMKSALQASVLSRQEHFEGKLIFFDRLLMIDEIISRLQLSLRCGEGCVCPGPGSVYHVSDQFDQLYSTSALSATLTPAAHSQHSFHIHTYSYSYSYSQHSFHIPLSTIHTSKSCGSELSLFSDIMVNTSYTGVDPEVETHNSLLKSIVTFMWVVRGSSKIFLINFTVSGRKTTSQYRGPTQGELIFSFRFDSVPL